MVRDRSNTPMNVSSTEASSLDPESAALLMVQRGSVKENPVLWITRKTMTIEVVRSTTQSRQNSDTCPRTGRACPVQGKTPMYIIDLSKMSCDQDYNMGFKKHDRRA